MAEPTLGLTFDDMRIRVAEHLGIAYYGAAGNEAAQLPTDAHDLDLVSRLVNDGYRRFLSERAWSFMRPLLTIVFRQQYDGSATAVGGSTLSDSTRTQADDFFNGYSIRVTSAATGDIQVRTVTDYVGATGQFVVGVAFSPALVIGDTYTVAPAECVEGQNHRYYLPDDFFGVIHRPFTYGEDGPITSMEPSTEWKIRELRAGQDVSGQPTIYAVAPINTSVTTDGDRWEAIFWPRPNILEAVQCRYQRYPNKLTTGTHRHVAGFQHDAAVLAAAKAEAELQQEGVEGAQSIAYDKALARSVMLDDKSTPVRIGGYGDRSFDTFPASELRYDGVDTVDGEPV